MSHLQFAVRTPLVCVCVCVKKMSRCNEHHYSGATRHACTRRVSNTAKLRPKEVMTHQVYLGEYYGREVAGIAFIYTVTAL